MAIAIGVGSHGGAMAEGQREVLANYGITKASMDVPIKSSLEVMLVEVNEEGFTVYIDKKVYEADGIIVINRFKPHPAFRGRYECSLMKMLAIGLGKQQGAQVCRRNRRSAGIPGDFQGQHGRRHVYHPGKIPWVHPQSGIFSCPAGAGTRRDPHKAGPGHPFLFGCPGNT